MIRNRCPVCRSNDVAFYTAGINKHGPIAISTKVEHTYNQCRNCELIYKKDIPNSTKAIIDYYQGIDKNKSSAIEKTTSDFYVYLINLFKKYWVHRFVRSRNENIKLLDVGCGEAEFLKVMDNNRFNLTGIDFRVNKKISNESIGLIEGSFLEHNFDDREFDVITMWHVIEHLPNPYRLFNKIDRVLKKDGVVFISTPNTSSFGMKLGKSDWFHFDIPRHLNLYNIKSMQELSMKTNFELIKTINPVIEFPLDLFWSLKNNLEKVFVYPLYPFFKIFDKETCIYIFKKR